MTDFNALISEMSSWNNGKGIDVDSWIGCVGNFRHGTGYSRIFWPTFAEHDDMVFRDGFKIGNVTEFMTQRKGDKTLVEAVMNHLHIADPHYVGSPDISRERLVYLGQFLRKIHMVKLAHDFPHRLFEVLFDDGFKDDLFDNQMTFFPKR